MAFLSEAEVEQALLEQFESFGYAVAADEVIGPDGRAPERESHAEVILKKRFEDAVARLNPGLPAAALQDAVCRVLQSELPSLLEENRRIHRLLTEGVYVEYDADDGTLTAGKVALIDFERPERNDWLAVQQFVVISGQNNRRPDVVLSVNGLPLAVIELKAPGSAGAHLLGACNQLQTYKQQIPALFHTNALLVTSDGIGARAGSLSADIERFMPWRTTNGRAIAPKGAPELSTLIEGVFEQRRFLSLLCDFTVFGETGSGLVKIIAGYHQFHAVRHAVASTIRATGNAVAEILAERLSISDFPGCKAMNLTKTSFNRGSLTLTKWSVQTRGGSLTKLSIKDFNDTMSAQFEGFSPIQANARTAAPAGRVPSALAALAPCGRSLRVPHLPMFRHCSNACIAGANEAASRTFAGSSNDSIVELPAGYGRSIKK